MKKNIQYIGVAGTAGSGKDTAAMLMGEMFGSIGLSTGDMVRAIARQVYHLPEHVRPTRDQSYIVATFMRNNISPSSIIELCLLEGEAQNVSIVIIHGLRTMGEAEVVREAGGIIVGVDAEAEKRYERLKKDRDMLKTYEEFLEQEKLENEGVSKNHKDLGIRHIIESADVKIDNNGSIEDLEAQIREKVEPLLKR
jgi:dephospho-CoA kinase